MAQNEPMEPTPGETRPSEEAPSRRPVGDAMTMHAGLASGRWWTLTLAEQLGNPRWTGPRLREIARTREVVCDFLVGDNAYGSTPELVDAYFLAFAVAARRDR